MAFLSFLVAVCILLATGADITIKLRGDYHVLGTPFSSASGAGSHEALSLLQTSVQRPSNAVPKRRRARAQQQVLWIKAFPRSGSSLLFSLVSQVNRRVFALFEPCSEQDSLEPWLAKKGCSALLSQLAQCNFAGVKEFRHWGKSLTNGAAIYFDGDSASSACKSADLVILKTINWGHNLDSEMIPFLRANPQVQGIDLIRDPRSIYRSMAMTAGFSWVENTDDRMLFEMCDQMYQGLNVSHPRMLRVSFENLLKKPVETSKTILSFMRIPAETGAPKLMPFLRNHINSNYCPGSEEQFTICRTNSSEALHRYTKLPMDQQVRFSDTESCNGVVQFYGYTP